MPFTIRFSDGGDGWVMAQVQEVPGAVGHGRTEAEARANVVDALLLILCSDAGSMVDAVRESQVLPEPVGQRFDTRVSLGESETTVSLPALRLIGTGDTFDAAVDDLVEVLHEYSSQYLRRIDFDRQAAQGNLSPLILVLLLTPAEEQRDLLLRPPSATVGALRRTLWPWAVVAVGRTRWKPKGHDVELRPWLWNPVQLRSFAHRHRQQCPGRRGERPRGWQERRGGLPCTTRVCCTFR